MVCKLIGKGGVQVEVFVSAPLGGTSMLVVPKK
jgi:hypothetical protein